MLTERISVLVTDDHPIMRDGIVASIQRQPDMEVVAEAATGLEALEMFRVHRPLITIMDLQMPVMNGIDAMIAIRRDNPAAKIIVLTTFRGDVQVTRAIRAGASAFLQKNLIRKELVDTIHAVVAGKRVLSEEASAQLAQHYNDDMLSEREILVLQQVSQGRSNREIAELLLIKEDTVKGHMKQIMNKLQASDRTHAVMIALERGILFS
ncbi:MAG: response regulator transcription factor [Gammaproteobacteria bacterium]